MGLFHTALCRDPPWISPHVISATGVMICCFVLSSTSQYQSLRTEGGPLLRSSSSCRTGPAKCGQRATQQHLRIISLVFVWVLATRSHKDSYCVVLWFPVKLSWSHAPPEVGQGSAQPCQPRSQLAQAPPGAPLHPVLAGYAVAGSPEQLSG